MLRAKQLTQARPSHGRAFMLILVIALLGFLPLSDELIDRYGALQDTIVDSTGKQNVKDADGEDFLSGGVMGDIIALDQSDEIDAPMVKSQNENNAGVFRSNREENFDPDQCRNVEKLFPPSLPVSPNKRHCEMMDLRNVSHTCSAEAGKRFREALTDDVVRNSLVWMQLAMPSTGSTSMDHYMALGGNMSPLLRAGGCENACLARIGPSQIPSITNGYAAIMGFQTEQIQRCDASLFHRWSSIVRCPHSGGHMDYLASNKLATWCLAATQQQTLSGSSNIHITASSLNKKTLIGTTLRNPIQYHYKEFKYHGVPDWRDYAICQLWEEMRNNETYGFACTKTNCLPELEPGSWCIDGNFSSYMQFAHHRWNLFTRMLAGSLAPKHVPVHGLEDVKRMHATDFTREYALLQNKLGTQAPDYKLAVARLESMPHFSIFERMSESMELLCFTYCYNCAAIGFDFAPRTRDQVPDDIIQETSQYHVLDLILYEYANRLLTRRLHWMKEQKAKGIQCDLLLSGCGLTCMD